MSSRDISGTILRTCFGAVRKDVTLSKILSDVLDAVASAERDIDKCGDMEDHAYYTGVSDMGRMVAEWIAPIKADKSEFYHNLMGLQRPDILPKENAA